MASLQQLDDMVGGWWSDGQMGSLWLESVLIGRPDDGDCASISLSVRVGSSGSGAGFVARDLLLHSGFFDVDSVASFKSGIKNRALLSKFSYDDW